MLVIYTNETYIHISLINEKVTDESRGYIL